MGCAFAPTVQNCNHFHSGGVTLPHRALQVQGSSGDDTSAQRAAGPICCTCYVDTGIKYLGSWYTVVRSTPTRLTGIGVAVGAMSPLRPNMIWGM